MTITTMNTQSILSHYVESADEVRARRDTHRGSDVVGSSPSTTMLMKIPFGPPSQAVVLFTFLCANLATAHGHPLDDSKESLHRLYSRDTSKNTVIPIAVVVGVALVLGIFIIWKCHKACLRFLRRCREHVGDPEAVNYSTEPQELTAEQLAGTINGPGYTPRTTRRGRRTRRTPSQISTHSLPVYAKEPGEQEIVVILQGPAGMEEVQMPQPLATVVDLGEEAEAEARMTDAQRLQYSPMPDSSPNSPLLDQDQHAAPDILAPTLPSISHRHSGSTGTGSDSADTSSLAPIESADHNNPASTTDRGEAPPYFEVVDGDHTVRRDIANAGPNNASTNPTPAPTISPPSSPTRRAGLRSLLNRVSGSAVSHVRNSSSLSGVSFHSHSRSHGRGPSVASVLRPSSRPRSSASHNVSRPNLSSPSMISLNSISAPLTHTAVRTEFTYPRGGLTADQMRMISSRDSLVRFGVPYGPDAIAFASLSRENLGEMPPEFEETVAPGGGSNGDTNSNSAVGTSDGEDGENARVQEATTSNGDSQVTVTGDSTTPSADGLPGVQVPAEINVEGLPAIDGAHKESGAQKHPEKEEQPVQRIDHPEQETQSRSNPDPTTPDHSKAEDSGDQGKMKVMAADNQSQLVHEPEQEAQGSSHVDPTIPHDTLSKETSDLSSSPETRTAHSMIENPITTIVQPPTPLTSPTVIQPLTPSKALTDELPSDAPQSVKPSAPPPPSSFHPVSSQDTRPESRISQVSYASDGTFRTAAESMSSRWRRNTSDDEDDEDDETWERERSPTPTSGGKDTPGYGEEALDNIITNSTSESRTSSLNRMKHMSSATIRGP